MTDLVDNILITLGSRLRWWSTSEVAQAIDEPYLSTAAALAQLAADGRINMEQVHPDKPPRWGTRRKSS